MNDEGKDGAAAPIMNDGAFLQSVLDALEAHVAVLDADGRIVAVNENWRRGARENGPKINETGLGENYLAACDAAAKDQKQARIAAGGIRAVLRGDSPSFQMEYPCGIPGEGRWMLMRAAPLGGADRGVVIVFENFTARLAAEMELRKNEALLRKIFEMLPVGLWMADDQGKLLFGNPAGVRIWGGEPRVGPENYGVFKARRLPSREEIAPDDWALSRSIREGVTIREELLEIDALDGETRIVLNYTAPVKNEEGDVRGAIVVNQDITELHRTEERLREAMAYQQALFDAINDGVLVLDQMGQVIDVNGAVCRLYGYSREEIIRLPLEAATAGFPPFDRDHAMAFLQKARMEGPQIFEWRARHKSGSLFWVELHACFVRISGQDRFIVTVRDIGDRKQAEQNLRESEQRLSILFGNLPGMAYRCLNDPEWPMVFVSEGCRNLTGYGQEDLTRKDGMPYGSLIHPDDREMVWDAVQAGIALETHFEVSYRILHRDGGIRWVWDKGTAIVEDGEPRAIEGFISDITAHRRAEEAQAKLERQIQQTQKLESLGVLAGGIAHDFNNILMAVLGHAELAMEEVSSASPTREHLREIEDAARRAADLCRQMHAYSGKATFSQKALSLPEVIHEMAHLLKASVSKKAVLNLHTEQGLPKIFADPGQMRQTLLNLVINASEAIGERSGVITVSAGATRCDSEYLRKTELYDQLPEGLYVHLEVADTGCGMDAETRRRLFEPFFSTKFTGRGLGLAAVLGIVRAHRGALMVYTEPGKGSTFKILFPALDCARESAEAERERRIKNLWRGRGTVLLVDDEESLRALGAKILESMGLTVITAEDGCGAVECYRASGGDIDLVMLDLTMPHMDGAEAFGELRRINPDVRVILASGYGKDDVLARFPGKGLAGVIQKPYTISVLREILSQLLPAAGE